MYEPSLAKELNQVSLFLTLDTLVTMSVVHILHCRVYCVLQIVLVI